MAPLSAAETTRMDNGLDLQCRQPEPAWLDCDYRLVKPTGVKNVAIRVGTFDIPAPEMTPYPYEGATSAILFLVDTSDPQRQPVIDRNIEHITKMLAAGESHHSFGLATFNSALRMEASFDSPKEEFLASLDNIKAVGKTTELYRNTLLAIRMLAERPVGRKAIFLFSDGLAEDHAYFHQDVVRAARRAGVAVYGFGYPQSTALSVALQTLRRLSEETGGLFAAADVGGAMADRYLTRPYGSMDSGGRLEIDLSWAIEAGLGGGQAVAILLETERGAISETVKVDLPTPAPVAPVEEVEEAAEQQPTAALAEQQPLPITPPAPRLRPKPIRVSARETRLSPADYFLIGGAGIFFLLVLALAWQRFRRKKPPADAVTDEEGIPLGYLEFRDESERPPVAITATSMRIGRHLDNDLCLDDPSVSRHHAEVHRRRDGSFTITDLDSLNGVYVKDKQVKNASLGEGDAVEVGDVRLRFTLYAGEKQGQEQTVLNMDKTVITRTKEPQVGGGVG